MAEEAPISFLNTCARFVAASSKEYDVKDLKFRVGQIEQTLVHHSLCFDRLESRLDLIEKRLGLVDA